MSPQTGPDLVGAGYPISYPLLALLGGTGLAAQPNVAARTNMSWGLGNLTDAIVGGSIVGGSVMSMAVPVMAGDVITKISLLTGATASTTSGSVTNLWAALYTGTGSAPGTTGAQPSFIASGISGSVAGSVGIPSSARFDFTLTSPQTITSVQAPFGFIYASFSLTTSGTASPSNTSFICVTNQASGGSLLYYPGAPVGLFLTSNATSGSTAPATLGTATRTANPPVVILT